MTTVDIETAAEGLAQDVIRVDHFIRGRLVEGGAMRYRSRDLGVERHDRQVRDADRVRP